MAIDSARRRQARIYFFGGLAYVILFGILMLTAFPPSKSIVPPLMIGIGLIEMVVAALFWYRFTRRPAR